ncbi:MAG: hypothetical protein H6835_07975 [Planctomycetes bacterium]|nr:hypothetical protein [Planctomycetota bacterium]
MSYLGLDVGGTRCRYEWWPAGTAGGGEAEGVQPAVHGIERTAQQLAEVIAFAQQHQRAEAVVCAVAGAGDPSTANAIVAGLELHGTTAPVAVVGDVLAAAAAGLADGPGVVIWSGTGSFAVARGRDGKLWRVGGRGYLFGDQGSGFDLVRRAVTAAVLSLDGLGPDTALLPALTAAFAAPSPQRLGATAQRLPPREIAARAPVVLEACAAGDAVAVLVAEEAAAALEALGRAACIRASLQGEPCEHSLALGGGVLTGSPVLAERLRERIARSGATPRMQVLDALAAARGAAWLARGWHEGIEPQHGWVDDVAL